MTSGLVASASHIIQDNPVPFLTATAGSRLSTARTKLLHAELNARAGQSWLEHVDLAAGAWQRVPESWSIVL